MSMAFPSAAAGDAPPHAVPPCRLICLIGDEQRHRLEAVHGGIAPILTKVPTTPDCFF